MTTQLHYGTPAKIFHWLIVALLAVQYPIGWLMPDLHRDMTPGAGMTFHVSIGLTILVLTALRLFWRLTHPVAPESSLPAWQRLSSEAVHWLLYVLVLDVVKVRYYKVVESPRSPRWLSQRIPLAPTPVRRTLAGTHD